MLEDHYGRVLEAGKLRLEMHDGAFSIAYGSSTFPLAPATYAYVLRPLVSVRTIRPNATAGRGQAATTRQDAPGDRAAATDADAEARRQLRVWLTACVKLGRSSSTRRRGSVDDRRGEVATLKSDLAALLTRFPDLRSRLDGRIAEINGTPGDPRSVDELDALLDDQHYRLARWQTGAHDTNYRRFFAINSLIGLRMESPEVFRDSHALVRQLIRADQVHGLRIDHIDGLRDPEEYLDRLQQLAAEVHPGRAPLFVVVEKILAPHESLPPNWPAHGTTGYEFIAELAGLLVDESERAPIHPPLPGRSRATDAPFTKKRTRTNARCSTMSWRTRRQHLSSTLAALIARDRRWRDLTHDELRLAIREIVSGLHVYRTYRRAGMAAPAPQDRREVDEAVAIAIRRNPVAGPEAFAFVGDILAGRYPTDDAPAAFRDAVTGWVLTFQQHTGAVMAKAVEDTTFFTFNRFIALNEVGGDPGRFGRDVEDFHRRNQARAAGAPLSLLATSTHDTKLGEDSRARLYAVSEIPDEWTAWLDSWRARNRARKTIIDGQPAPDDNEEYRLYQTLLGAWPVGGGCDDDFRARVREASRKAANEARTHGSWQRPNDAWLRAGDAFIDAILTDVEAGGFVESMSAAAGRVAAIGVTNSLTQVLLKIACPGIPDVYQGNEGWDLHLVDPDNRRPVDFAARRELAGVLDARSWTDLLTRWQDGGIKMRVLRDLLRFRARHRALFELGDYQPVPTRGPFADRVIAFSRSHAAGALVIVAPRLSARVGTPPLGAVWGDTAIAHGLDDGVLRDVLTGREWKAENSSALRDVLVELPIAALHLTRD